MIICRGIRQFIMIEEILNISCVCMTKSPEAQYHKVYCPISNGSIETRLTKVLTNTSKTEGSTNH